jgi:hypothetical protein
MADSSSKLIKALFSSSNSGENKTNFDASKINPRILSILGVNEFDIEDEQEYLSLLKEKMLLISMEKSKLPREDEEVIIEEFKRIKSKKFPKKKITADSFKRGTAVEGFINKNVGVNLNTKSLGGSIKPQQLALPPAVDKMSGKSDIQEIIDSLASIIEQLTLFNSLSRNEQERDRRATENRRRREREGELEKGFDGAMKEAEKVIAPVKSILDRIINFLVMTLIGRSLVLILRWFSDPENKEKVKAIGRFLGDHWPKLLALFIVFGTSFGRFALGLTKVVTKGAIKLGFAIAKLLAAKKVKGAMGAARFLGGKKAKLAANVLATGAVLGGTLAVTQGFKGDGEDQKTQKLAGGGYVKPRFAAFSGGGLNLKGMLGGAALGAGLGSMFGPLGMLLGAGLGGAAGSGFVSGEKGVDKVPAMLSDGEFVMSPGAVQKYGVGTLEAMNAAGGGTNKPKIMNGTTYAAGGGLIGDINPYNPNQMSDVDFRRYVDGRIEERMADRRIAELRGRSNNLPKLNTPRSNPPRIDPSRMLPSAGQSSANPPRIDPSRMLPSAGQPISSQLPTSSYRYIPPDGGMPFRATGPGGDARIQRLAGQSGNMKSSLPSGRGGIGGLRSAGIEILANYLMERGFDKINAVIIAKKIDEGKKLTGDKKENYVERLRNIVDREERWQRGFGGIFDSILGMGKESSSQKMSKSAKAILEGIGSGAYQGGGIVGGSGLKDQSFRDAPKTSIITDDKGRPFVGHKALRGGKLVYVRGPEPGTGTTNPLEMLGRMINPGAYKENDAKLAGQKHKEAMVNSLQSFQERGMSPNAQARMMKQMGGNLKDVQNDLDFRKKTQAKIAPTKPTSKSSAVTPPQQNKVNVTYVESMKKRRAARTAGGTSSAAPQVPQFSSSSRTRSRKRTASTYGIG